MLNPRKLENNWLPSPNGEFYMLLRLYWPTEEWNSGKWVKPEITIKNQNKGILLVP